MSADLLLRRKWTLRAHGKQVVFVKRANERTRHVLMKAFLWALYLPCYPNLRVEVSVGDRYKPDVVALDPVGRPLFWGEAGQLGVKKIRSLIRRHRQTHFAVAKWSSGLEPWLDLVGGALAGMERTVPFDLLSFPADSTERFIDRAGEIRLSFSDVNWIRLD